MGKFGFYLVRTWFPAEPAHAVKKFCSRAGRLPRVAGGSGARRGHPLPETLDTFAACNRSLGVCSTTLTMQKNSSIIPTITTVPRGVGFALSKVP